MFSHFLVSGNLSPWQQTVPDITHDISKFAEQQYIWTETQISKTNAEFLGFLGHLANQMVCTAYDWAPSFMIKKVALSFSSLVEVNAVLILRLLLLGYI